MFAPPKVTRYNYGTSVVALSELSHDTSQLLGPCLLLALSPSTLG